MPSLATNSAITLTITVRNTSGSLVNPDTISLKWKLGSCESWTSVAQGSITHVSTGVYSYQVTPEDVGRFEGWPTYLHYRWEMTNPTYIEKGKVSVSTEEFVS